MTRMIVPDALTVAEHILSESMERPPSSPPFGTLAIDEQLAKRVGPGAGPVNMRAFEEAREAFDVEYRRAFRPGLPSDADEARGEALDVALEAFLGTYLREAAR